MAAEFFKNELVFNYSIYKRYEVERWKFLEEIQLDPGVQAGPLLKSPWPIISLTSIYITFVCFVGPFLMRNRQPFHLKNTIRFYNLLMVFVAGILLYRLLDAVESLGSMFDRRKMFDFSDQSGTKIHQMGNFILAVRISEYLDTIFFTLRKKQNQVTFLHVFHHAFVPIYAYWILRTAPLRFNVFIILINSFIHVLMYFYYFLATFQPPRDPSNKNKQPRPSFLMLVVMKLLMFKKYMTQLQILQFVTLAFYAGWVALEPGHCGVPWTYILSNMMLAFGFLGLFVHFYVTVYKADSNAAAKSRRE